MHDPVSFDSLGRSTFVKDESFLDTHVTRTAENCFVCAGRLPITGNSCSVWPDSVWILPVSRTEEIPLIFSKLCFLCSDSQQKSNGRVNITDKTQNIYNWINY